MTETLSDLFQILFKSNILLELIVAKGLIKGDGLWINTTDSYGRVGLAVANVKPLDSEERVETKLYTRHLIVQSDEDVGKLPQNSPSFPRIFQVNIIKASVPARVLTRLAFW